MSKPRKFLIAAGTAEYPNLAGDQQLPSVGQDIERLARWFTLHGYEHVLPELGNSPSSDELRQNVGDWFTNQARTARDHVVFYYSGHGEVLKDGSHYLCGRDAVYSDSGELRANRGYPDNEIALAIAQSRVQHVLIILDTCFSAAGIRSFSQRAAVILSASCWDSQLPHGIHLIAAARERQVAHEDVFSRVFCEVLDNRQSQLGGRAQRFLRPPAVIGAVNRLLQQKGIRQTAAYGLATPIFDEVAELLPNPQYQTGRAAPRMGSWTRDKPDQAAAASSLYFTGRRRAVTELVEWLRGGRADGRVRIVTGSPGAGKSALLDHVIALVDAEAPEESPPADQTLPPVPGGARRGRIDLAIYARGRSIDEIVAIVAGELQCEPKTASVVEVLERRQRPFTLVIDALDEAFDLVKITSELLRSIAAIPTVRLLVGSRPDARSSAAARRVSGFGADTVEIDLDKSAYFDAEDVESYVIQRLLAEDEPDRPTPYRGRPDLAKAIAKVVAAQSGTVFLFARVIADTLLTEALPRDARNAADCRFPEALSDAFDTLFRKFDQPKGLNKTSVLDLLRPLAFAEGSGLPWEHLWAPLAAAIAARPYDDAAVAELFRTAPGFIVESLENGRSVYRLYHEELEEYLRRDRDARTIHGTIATMLVALVAKNANGACDWREADPYALTHLAAHAAKAGMLEELLLDPLFVAAADRQRLIANLPLTSDDQLSRLAFLYRLSYHHLAAPDLNLRLSYLELIARTNTGAPASWADAAIECKPWRIPWANWRMEAPHWTIVVQRSSRDMNRQFSSRLQHVSARAVSSVAVTRLGHVSVIVSGSIDGTMKLWRLSDGTPLAPEVVAHEAAVNQLAAITLEERLLIVSAGDDGVLALWEPSGPLRPRTLFAARGYGCYAVSAKPIGGRWTAAFGGGEGVLRLVDIESGVIEPWNQLSDDPAIYAVHLGHLDGIPVVISGGSFGEVSCWELTGSRRLVMRFDKHHHAVLALGTVRIGGLERIVALFRDGVVLQWDAAGTLVDRRPTGHDITPSSGWIVSGCFAQFGDAALVAAVDYRGEIRIADLADGRLVVDPVLSDMGQITAIAFSAEDRSVFVSGENDGSLRVRPSSSHPVPILPSHEIGHVRCLSRGRMNGRAVVMAGTMDGSIHICDIDSGTWIKMMRTGSAGHVQALAYVERNGRPFLIAGASAGQSLQEWDLSAGTARARPFASCNGTFAMETFLIDNQPFLAFQGSNREIVIWDLATDGQAGPPIHGHTRSIYGLCSQRVDGNMLLASSGPEPGIRLWDVDAGAPYGSIIDPSGSSTAALAFGRYEDRIALFSGSYGGEIRVFDVTDGRPLCPSFFAHVDPINVIVLGKLDGQTVGISGGADGTLVVWRPNGEILHRIDLGAWILAMVPITADRVAVGTAKGLLAISVGNILFEVLHA